MKKGLRKVLVSIIFALIGVTLAFYSKFDSIVADYLWKVFGVLVAGNSVEYLVYLRKKDEK